MKIRLFLIFSVLVNVSFIVFIYYHSRTSPPPFQPFHVETNFGYSDLVADEYAPVMVDVLMLGKTIGELTVNYQLDEENGKTYWRNAIINLQMEKLDTLKVFKII